MMSKEFLYWEQSSRDTIDFKMIYVDIAGDIVTGLLLSQIIYWNLPNKEGKTKLRVKNDNELWLAKGRTDWHDECRISPKQFDRSIKILESKNIVETKLKKFNGTPTKHIKLNIDVLTGLINEIINPQEDRQRVNSILPKGENPIHPKGKIDFTQKGKSLTEITTEITTEIKKPSQKRESENDKIINDLQNQIKERLNIKLTQKNIKDLYIILASKGIDYINNYINNFNKFNIKGINFLSSFFISVMRDECPIPTQEAKNTAPNMANFEEREYTTEDFEQYYYKVEG